MLEHFSKLLKERHRFKKTSRLILAVSGGLDSVVLVDLISKTDYDFAIAHVNFLLRGDDSEKDEHFVEELSKCYEIPFYSLRENAELKSKEWKQSVQMAARKIRYDYFQRLIDEFDYNFILTAHHLDDSFETALLNFIKSGSYSSISGIPAINENIIRPLISYPRKDIMDYAQKNELKWREDKSNAALKYQRNIVRHKIIPTVEEINVSYLKTFSEASDQMHLLSFYLKEQLKDAMSTWIQVGETNYLVEIARLIEKPHDLLILWEFLKKLGFNFSQFQEIVKSINSESGKKFISEEYICVKDREYFIISANEVINNEILIQNFDKPIAFDERKIKVEYLNGGIEIENDEKIALIDADKIQLPLKLRIWKEGDKFQPLGMNGIKKVSDFLIDLKVPLNNKRKQYVLLSGEDIIWLVGMRINNKYRITKNTKQAIRFELK